MAQPDVLGRSESESDQLSVHLLIVQILLILELWAVPLAAVQRRSVEAVEGRG